MICLKEMKQEGCYMNMRSLMSRLQTALCVKGVHVSINQFQHYSEKARRMVTKFVVTTPRFVEEEKKIKNVAICETYKTADVVQALAGLLKDDGGGHVC